MSAGRGIDDPRRAGEARFDREEHGEPFIDEWASVLDDQGVRPLDPDDQPDDRMELTPEAAAWDRELKVDDSDRAIFVPAVSRGRRALRTLLVFGVLAGASALAWEHGSSWYRMASEHGPALYRFLASETASSRPPEPKIGASADGLDPRSLPAPDIKPSAPSLDSRTDGNPQKGLDAAGAPRDAVRKAATKAADSPKASAPANGAPPAEEAAPSKIEEAAQQPAPIKAATAEPESQPRRTPTPDTRPTTIPGWKLREVIGDTVVLEGPDGVRRARQGETVPGVGKVHSVVRWGNHLLVATSRGLIGTW